MLHTFQISLHSTLFLSSALIALVRWAEDVANSRITEHANYLQRGHEGWWETDCDKVGQLQYSWPPFFCSSLTFFPLKCSQVCADIADEGQDVFMWTDLSWRIFVVQSRWQGSYCLFRSEYIKGSAPLALWWDRSEIFKVWPSSLHQKVQEGPIETTVYGRW